MAQQAIPQWIINRILEFLNRARTPEDIAGDGTPNPENPLDPDNWYWYSIGNRVAAHILETRNALPRRRFTKLEEVRKVQGLGSDKLADLVELFQLPSADAFREGMFTHGVIRRENWDLHNFTTFFDTEDAYNTVAHNDANLRAFVMKQIEKTIAPRVEKDKQKCWLIAQLLKDAYIDRPGAFGDYIFALWFYRFDYDNWFNFDQVLARTALYFDYHPQSTLDLHLFKGFNNRLINKPAVVPEDLPVVTSDAERSVTIWVSALYD